MSSQVTLHAFKEALIIHKTEAGCYQIQHQLQYNESEQVFWISIN